MEQLKEYILSIVSAALLVGIVRELLGKKSGMGVLVYLISGLLLTAVVVKPIASLDLTALSYNLPITEISADVLIAEGKQQSAAEQNAIIKQTVETYILDKAKEYGVDVTAEVVLSDRDPPVPQNVRIQGSVSPYIKMQLSNFIRDELGILEVNQDWTGPR